MPNSQIGHLDPQSDEEGNDIYPVPQSGMAERGRKIYVANGCFYCHSQQVRAGLRRLGYRAQMGRPPERAARLHFRRPARVGKMRMGPDLSNIGKRAPADDARARPRRNRHAASAAARCPRKRRPHPAASPASVTGRGAAASPAASPVPAATSPVTCDRAATTADAPAAPSDP